MTDEYIRKDDAASIIEKEMKNYVSDIWYKSATHSALNDVNENIKSLKPADVVRVVHGRWIKEYRAKGQVANMCTECGGETGRVSKFCPNCGAKMDSKREE